VATRQLLKGPEGPRGPRPQSTPADNVQTQQEATTQMLPEDTAQNPLEITLENNVREDTTAS